MVDVLINVGIVILFFGGLLSILWVFGLVEVSRHGEDSIRFPHTSSIELNEDEDDDRDQCKDT